MHKGDEAFLKKFIIVANKPVKVSLSKGLECHFCTYGKSKSQPFCDGSHQQFSNDQVGKKEPEIASDESLLPKPRSTYEEPTLVLLHQLVEEGLYKLIHSLSYGLKPIQARRTAYVQIVALFASTWIEILTIFIDFGM